jgi:hypothetical protein
LLIKIKIKIHEEHRRVFSEALHSTLMGISVASMDQSSVMLTAAELFQNFVLTNDCCTSSLETYVGQAIERAALT